MASEVMFVLVMLAFLGLLWIPFWCMKNIYAQRMRELELYEPLLQPTEHRLDVALREAQDGYNACRFCGFENFKRIPFCSVCGEGIAEHEELAARRRTSKWPFLHWRSSTMHNIEIITHSPGHDASVTSRQRRARKRKEWTRKADGEDSLLWQREDKRERSRIDSVGYVVRFQLPPLADFPEDNEEVVEVVTLQVQPINVPDEPEVVPVNAEELPANSSTEQPEADLPEEVEEETPSRRVPLILPSRQEQGELIREETVLITMTVIDAAATNAAEFPIPEPREEPLNCQEVLQLTANDFPSKYAHFVTRTSILMVPPREEQLKLNVTRANLLEDSIESLSIIPSASVRSTMRINFVDESGVDAGGLHREWFVLLNEAIVEPAAGVFSCVNAKDQTYYLNGQSSHNLGKDHLLYFFASGRLIGRTLLEGYVLGFHLCLPLLKIILGIPVSFSDLEFFDPETYKNMVWIMEHDGVDALGLDFSVTERAGEQVVVVDLIPNGRNIDVTDKNKLQYLERKFQYLLFESVSSQLYVFLKGLYEIVPQDLLMLFDPEEFAYLLCGSDEIDVNDWERSTKYTAHLHHHPCKRWFWELVREMPNEYRRRLLQFATGSSRVPLAGFSALTSYDGKLCPFTLKAVPLVDEGYISSHACFNTLDLPLHVVREELKKMLYAILDTEVYGFTIA